MTQTQQTTAAPGGAPDISDLLAAARAGDGHAFQALVAPHLRALHLHSYRMLGSYDEAEEAVQEALLRAWRSLRTYEGRAPLRHWLFRITTTTCLKAIGSRARRPAVTGEITYLQPDPDRLLDQLTDRDSDPAIVIERRPGTPPGYTCITAEQQRRKESGTRSRELG